MICITMCHQLSHTIVSISGRLTASDWPIIRQTRESVSGAVVLDLGGLETYSREGVQLLQDWLDAGASLDATTPYLQMVLRDRKAGAWSTESGADAADGDVPKPAR